MSRDISTVLAEFTIKDMAEMSGLSEYTLRYYESIGLIDTIPRDESSGHRRYTSDTAIIIDVLACLRTSGMKISDMRQYINLRKRGDSGAAKDQVKLFKAAEQDLDTQIQKLEARKQYIARKIEYWQARADGDNQRAGVLAVTLKQLARKLNNH